MFIRTLDYQKILLKKLDAKENAVLGHFPKKFILGDLTLLWEQSGYITEDAITWQAYFCALKWFYDAVNDRNTTVTVADLQAMLDDRAHNRLFAVQSAVWEADYEKLLDALPTPQRKKYESYFREYWSLRLEKMTLISYMIAYIAFWKWADLFKVIDDRVTLNPRYITALDELILQHLDLTTTDVEEIRNYRKKWEG